MRFKDIVLFSKFAYHYARYGFPSKLKLGNEVEVIDTNYIASYDLTDLPYYQKQCAIIGAAKSLGDIGKMEQVARELDNRLERTWGGQYVSPEDHKPLKVGKKHDLVLQTGLTIFALAIMENRGISFNHIASGDGTTDPMLGDLQLEAEKARMPIEGGIAFKFAAGSVLRWGGFFQPGFVTHIVAEIGVVSAATTPPGIFMNRALFPVSERISHQIFGDFYGVGVNISLSSV